jgi:hypothetical protein
MTAVTGTPTRTGTRGDRSGSLVDRAHGYRCVAAGHQISFDARQSSATSRPSAIGGFEREGLELLTDDLASADKWFVRWWALR